MVLSMRAAGSTGQGVPTTGFEGPPRDAAVDDDRGLRGKKKSGKKAGGRRGREDDEFEDSIGRRGFSGSGVTIGERLGILKGLSLREDDDEEKADEDKSDEADA
jgi:hypothetical protein